MSVNPTDQLPIFATSTPSKLGQARTLTIGQGEHSITAKTCRIGTGWFHALKGNATKHTVFIEGKKTTVYIPTEEGVAYASQWRNLKHEVPIFSKDKIHQLIEEGFQERTKRFVTDQGHEISAPEYKGQTPQGATSVDSRYTMALREQKQSVEKTIQQALRNLQTVSQALQSALTEVQSKLSQAHYRETSITPETKLPQAEALRDAANRAYGEAQELAQSLPTIGEETERECQTMLDDFHSTYPSENINALEVKIGELTQSQAAIATEREKLERTVEAIRLAAESASHKCESLRLIQETRGDATRSAQLAYDSKHVHPGTEKYIVTESMANSIRSALLMFGLDQTHGSLSSEDCRTLYTTQLSLNPYNIQQRTQEISLSDGKKVGISFIVSLPEWETRLKATSRFSSERDPNQLKLTAADIPTLREHIPLAILDNHRVILIDSLAEDSITYRDSFDQQIHTISLKDFLGKDIRMTHVLSLSFIPSVPTQ